MDDNLKNKFIRQRINRKQVIDVSKSEYVDLKEKGNIVIGSTMQETVKEAMLLNKNKLENMSDFNFEISLLRIEENEFTVKEFETLLSILLLHK